MVSLQKLLIRLLKIFEVLFVSWFASFIIVVSILAHSAFTSAEIKNESGPIIILGAGLNGEKPSRVLTNRLETALDCIKQREDVIVVVTGGQGRGEHITEAEAMKRYLTSHGVPEDIIVKEEYATSTMENLAFSKPLLKERLGDSFGSVTIVTSDFHVFRTRLIAGRVGLSAEVLGAGTPLYIYPNAYFREYFALLKSIVLDRPLPE